MLWISLICFILFAVLLFSYDSGWASSIDQVMLDAFDTSSFFTHFSVLGSQTVLGSGAVLLIVFLFWKRNIAGITAVLMGVGVGNLLNKALKEWVARERPPFPHGEDGFSFVSGHAMIGLVFYLLVAYFLFLHVKRTKLFYAAALLLALLAGTSRIAGHAHYATDVVAGWLLGGGIFLLLVFFLNRRFYHQPKQKTIV
ncbi:phosphatase PAP2 family protein [Domibacillus robiginosus]|uniref:phosphatase PAP2 family protein n=1 Tax=Domibacillus robiginosus TaxID=1071054 RepID=UPI00067D54FF|nr:phosphatase PAP2 family protein [Domibacillus robiginosus]